MGTIIGPYTADRVAAVKDFNRRLAAVQGDFRFPESSVPELPPGAGKHIYQEYFLATEDDEVRGGFILRHQDFSLSGKVCSVGHYRLPLSEGIADKTYAGVGVQMLRTALERQPLLFALGMGSLDKPLPRMLTAFGWAIKPVPFYFHVVHPFAFLRNLQPLRSGAKRVAADLSAFTGGGWAALRLAQRMRRGKAPGPFVFDAFLQFGDWADELWERCAPQYAFAAVRDSGSLNVLYPATDERLTRVRVTAGGEPAGWAVLYDAQMRRHRHFGDLRLGVVADCMAEAGLECEVIAAATAALKDRGVDLIISNQSHAAWRAALERTGYLRGRSNYLLAVSKHLGALIGPFERQFGAIHITRGDGDGLVNLT